MRAQSQLSVPPAPEWTSTIGVVGVRLAGQQRLELTPLALGLERLQRRKTLALGRLVTLGLAEFDERHRVVEFALNRRERA